MKNDKKICVSVVVPAYNEANAITKTAKEIHSVLSACPIVEDYEIIVIDDGSSDETWEIAKSIDKTRVIRHPHNAGYGQSLKDGILEASFDTIVITDADFTYPFDEVPSLLEKYREGFDMVVGARTGPEYRESYFKSPMRFLLKILVEFTVGRRVPDVNSGLRVFSREVVKRHFNQLSIRFSFTTSVTVVYMLLNKFVVYVPIPYRPRIGKSKIRILRDSLITLQYITLIIANYHPIKIFIIIVLFLLLLSFACIATGVSLGTSTPIWVGVVGVMFSCVVFSLGLLADLLRQMLALSLDD